MIIVYVDNDNLQFTKYESVLTSLFVNKKSFFKIFTNEYDLSKIDESFKNRHKFIVSNNNGKNSLDIAITIECMKDLMNNNNIHTFAIVSNDSDFIPLCKEIKEQGKNCYLYVDREHNQNIKDAYDQVINIGDFKKKEHQLREKEKQKELEKRNKLKNQQEKINIEKREKINQEKREGEIKKNKIKNILDNYFLTNTDVSITFDTIVKLFNRGKIKYNGKLGQFLEEHLSTDYKVVKIKDQSYVQKIGIPTTELVNQIVPNTTDHNSGFLWWCNACKIPLTIGPESPEISVHLNGKKHCLACQKLTDMNLQRNIQLVIDEDL